jgi:hypothetical protein
MPALTDFPPSLITWHMRRDKHGTLLAGPSRPGHDAPLVTMRAPQAPLGAPYL